MNRVILLVAICALSVLASACATHTALKRRHSFEKRTYAGTALDVEIIGGGGDYYDMGAAGLLLFTFSVVDLPFSFVADTVLLPYTVGTDVRDAKRKEGSQ